MVGVGVLAALAWLIVLPESTRSENAAAHDGITKNIESARQQLTKDIEGVEQRLTKHVEGVEQQLTRNTDDVKQDIREVKQDVRMLTAHLLNRNTHDPDARVP